MSESSRKKKMAHVIKRESGWALKKQGAQKASRIYPTKEEAVKDAKKLKRQGHDVFIHREDGSIEKWQKS
jgi:hypothetical protein